jgi:hypothetical protein
MGFCELLLPESLKSQIIESAKRIESSARGMEGGGPTERKEALIV